MMQYPPVPKVFVNLQMYQHAVDAAEWLTELNPKLPVVVEMTSWTPSEDGGIADDLIFADIHSDSPSRLQHLMVKIQELARSSARVEEFKARLVSAEQADAAMAHAEANDPTAAAMAKLYTQGFDAA